VQSSFLPEPVLHHRPDVILRVPDKAHPAPEEGPIQMHLYQLNYPQFSFRFCCVKDNKTKRITKLKNVNN